MGRWLDFTGRLGADIVDGITGGKRMRGIARANGQFAGGAAAHVRLDVFRGGCVGILLVIFQRPLPFGRVYDPKIADAGVFLRR